jgi:hypothetical protein
MILLPNASHGKTLDRVNQGPYEVKIRGKSLRLTYSLGPKCK